MITRLIGDRLPSQLRGLEAQAQYLPEAVRDSLHATLSTAADDATPEAVLISTFGRLGYLPGEAKQATLKVLAMEADPQRG